MTESQAHSQVADFVARIVDDHDDARSYFNRTLEREGIQTRCYPSGDEFLERDDFRTPGCIILDVKMPGSDGLTIQNRLIECQSPLPIIFVSGHGSVRIAAHAMRLGAIDFLEKPIEPERLIERVLEAFDLDRNSRDQSADRARAHHLLDKLTPREMEVLGYLVRGLPAKRIAVALGLSHKTIQVHRSNIMAKTGIDNVADLVRLALVTDGVNPTEAQRDPSRLTEVDD